MSASPRLGRGLAALIGDAPPAPAPAAGQGPIRTLAIEALEPGPFQPRVNFSADTLAELVASIRERGILQPLLARPHPTKPESYQIIAGERRWRAAQQAGLHELPVFVKDLADSEAMAASLVENLQRQDLNPIEEADGFRRLIEEFGLTQEQLGQAVGKSRSHIANAIRLLGLPDSVRHEVQAGKLSAGHARALLAHPEPEKAALAVIARGLNVRQTEALASEKSRKPDQGGGQQKDLELASLERDVSERLGLAVQITYDGRGGTVSIKYRSLEQLDGLLTVLARGS